MEYLCELALNHRELIEKKVAELCEADLYLKRGCISKDDKQTIVELLSSLVFELLSNENPYAEAGEVFYLEHITEAAKVKQIQNLMLAGNNYKAFLSILNYLKNTIRDIAFVQVKDNSSLCKCILENDRCFNMLQLSLYNLWEKLENSNVILNKIFDLTPFGAFIYEEDRFTCVNTAGERLCGYSSAELNTMSIFDLIHPDFNDLLIEKAKSWSANNDILKDRFNCKIINKNGIEVWVDISVSQVEIGGRICILSTAMDITEYKTMESSLFKSERKYKNFFNLSPDMIYLIDMKNGCIKEANPMMLNTLGVSLEEIRNMKLKDFFAGDNLDELNDSFKCLVQGNEIKGLNIKVKNVHGEYFDFEVNCTPIQEKGEVIRVLCLARNITERKKIDELKKQAYESMKLLNEALEYDKVKTEFFSNLSHELRTPLNVILGTLQLMDMFYSQASETGSEKIKRYCRIMRQNCYRLLRLVNNLIDINKLDAGYMNLNMDNYDIVSIVSKIASSVTDYIENKGITFSFNTKTSSKIIACDPDKIERIILNLLSNSVKFTESGGNIKTEVWDNGDSLFISVKDTGIGISKEKQDLVFKRFVQVDKSLSRSHQGSGIGLSLVKSLVELHGGTINLISDAGAGCDFVIELPIKQIVVGESKDQHNEYTANNRIEVINIEFADIYS